MNEDIERIGPEDLRVLDNSVDLLGEGWVWLMNRALCHRHGVSFEWCSHGGEGGHLMLVKTLDEGSIPRIEAPPEVENYLATVLGGDILGEMFSEDSDTRLRRG